MLLLVAAALAAVASPLRWDATDDHGRCLAPEALDEALSHRRPWHLHRALLDARPFDLLVTLFDEREVYTENQVVIWGLVDRQAVAYEAITLPDHRLYAGFSETCR